MKMTSADINRQEIYRYLGYRGIKGDENTDRIIDSCIKEVLEVSDMRHFYKRFSLEFGSNNLIKIDRMEFESKSLSKNFAGCKEVFLFAATLGMEVDRVLGRYVKLNMLRAAVFQSTAAAVIEAYCNLLQSQIEEEVKDEGLYLRPRFSPGYGDVNLEVQKDFLSLIDSPKTVGIILNEGGMMIPEKSVSAFMAISKEKTDCSRQGCEICGKKDCAYKR